VSEGHHLERLGHPLPRSHNDEETERGDLGPRGRASEQGESDIAEN
jgi:hypothetical protein